MRRKKELNRNSQTLFMKNGESEKEEKNICENCNAEIMQGKEFCPKCGAILVSTINSEWKNSKLAAAASLLWAGLGQVYNGETAKGFFIIIFQIIFVLMAVASFRLLFILPLIFLAWTVYDAYATAEIMNFITAIDRQRDTSEK